MASVPTASHSTAPATAGAAVAPPLPQAAADITAITTRDEFLLELGQTLAGQAAVHPVESLEAALAAVTSGRRAQLLVIDTRDVADVRAAVDAAHAAAPNTVVLVFAEGAAEKQLGAALKGSSVFAVLPLPIEARKTQAVLTGAIAEAVAGKAKPVAAPAPQPELRVAPPRPPPAAARGAREPRPTGSLSRIAVAGGAALAVLAAGALWFFSAQHTAPVTPTTSRATAPEAPLPAATSSPPAAPDTAILQGKVDELLEKARFAMHERRFSEPAGDNALLYYRSAAAADPASAEARDGLTRVAAVLAGRFEEALAGGRFEEATLTLANLKAATPDDAHAASLEQRLYAAEISRAIIDGNLDRAAAYLRQAQQSASVPAEQLVRWRADISHRQTEATVQRLSGLIEDRIRDGKLTDTDDGAWLYLQQLEAAAPAHAVTQRATRALINACLHKAREAALAKNATEEDRWLSEARALGLKPADLAAFQKDLAGARQKAVQAESERLLQLARDRLRDGRLTDPAQDSAAWYLSQLQTSAPGLAGLGDAGHELAARILERARASVLAGKPADADIAQAKRWGASAPDLAALQQLAAGAASKAAAADAAALATQLKRLRGVPPDYPPRALADHIAGSVTLSFTVDTKGDTRDIQVIEANPPKVFDSAAVNAVKRWHYAPLVVNGVAVEVPVKTRVRFELPK